MITMKKILLMGFAFMLTASALHAQTVEVKETPDKQKMDSPDGKTKVKPKTTVKDKAYNAVHMKKKRSHGTKTKTKNGSGILNTDKSKKESTTTTTTTTGGR
jgi:hypothetical protein